MIKMNRIDKKMNKIDLHLHTDCSDGRLSPLQLLDLCYQRGYRTISITDHDTIDGFLTVKEKAKEYGIDIIPGLEISSYHKGAEIHILAYHYDYENSELLGLLEYINESRIDRARKIIDKLQSIGFSIDFDEIFESVGSSGIIGRTHIAREIMKTETNLTVNEIFDRYLNENSNLYVPKITVSVKDTIPIIKDSGGISVLAHPHRLRRNGILDDIIAYGIDGIEVYCPKTPNYLQNMYLHKANENKLLVTGGSDFHCEPHEEADFGSFSVPESCLKYLNSFNQKTSDQEGDEYGQSNRFNRYQP